MPSPHSQKSIQAVVGPTSSGKTELALRLAREQDAEIISVDSRQVYQHLLVGTAKPKGQWVQQTSSPLEGEEKGGGPKYNPPSPPSPSRGEGVYLVEGIPYHLVDIWDPGLPFSAADFVRLARDKIAEIAARGRRPILVGGTGLYFKALIEGLAPLPPRNEAIRTALRLEAEKHGRAAMHHDLEKIDPEAARRIPANNIQRVIRALEVFKLTGKTISRWHEEHQAAREEEFVLHAIGIDLPREELQKRIELRCRKMIDQGMIKETSALLEHGYTADCPALTGLGYPLVIRYLRNEISRNDLLNNLIIETRQYAKRQMTWFRHQMKVKWNGF
jgi:tRNA dimethylallyltransferase